MRLTIGWSETVGWKIATFNVNGLRARLGIVLDWLNQQKPQVLCLQETKVPDPDFPAAALQEAGYRLAFTGQKSYNGVAVLCQNEPQETQVGLGDGEDDPEARFLAVKVDGVWVANAYLPQGRDAEDPSFQYKLRYFERVLAWLKAHHKPSGKLILTGDLNVAPQPIDVYDPKRLEGQPDYHPEVRAAFQLFLGWGLKDLYRQHHPEDKQFTFWDYRLPKAFQRNLGWRIDHILATAPLAKACRDCWVDSAPRGLAKPSDHTPVLAEFEEA
jgi:exodeoxyribonuclease-3